MNDTAYRLRALIPVSTDPDWLERMARDAESAASQPAPAQRRATDPISNLSDPIKTTNGTSR